MSFYTAYGLTFQSEIELPQLHLSASTESDVIIKRSSLNQQGLRHTHQEAAFLHVEPGKVWFSVPDVACFKISYGNLIEVDALSGVDEQSVRLFLLGSCIGAIMHQRNQLVIHGNAVRIGSECVVFAGRSGHGKSTLAGAFHQRGYEILSDDLAVLDQRFCVQPGIPQIKLWHDSAKKLDIDVTLLKRIRLQVDKYAYPLKQGFCRHALPMNAMYILHSHNQPDVLFEEVEGFKKFNPLKNNTYRWQQVKGLGLENQHLKLCSQLAGRIRITHITRPHASFELDQLVDLIEKDLAAKGMLAV